ncbi:hypothetical protein TNCV_3022791, partial [Trichonephila clavipes]
MDDHTVARNCGRDLNGTRYINEVLQPYKTFPFMQGLPGAVFQQDKCTSTCRQDCQIPILTRS